MQQITATTSWVAGEILSEKRVNEASLDEGSNDTNEDADFNNPEKNRARDWHVHQLLLHTSSEARARMNFLLLPGQNTYDFEAFLAAGLQPQNLQTYILNDQPKAVAQYLRNCRKFGVSNRRVGEMKDFFPNETTGLQGAYIDYFGQFCPGSSEDAHLLPLDPNHSSICIGYNFLKGREHKTTKQIASADRSASEFVQNNIRSVRNGFDLMNLHTEGTKVITQYEMSDLRDEVVFKDMFASAGTANQKNWLAGDIARSSAKLEPHNQDFDDLPVLEQYIRVHDRMKNMTVAGSMVDKFARQNGIYIWMSEAAAAASSAVLNRPIVRYLAEPFSYKSGESGKPYRSYFGVLETRRNHNMGYISSIEFMFVLADEITRRILPAYEEGTLKRQVVIDVSDVIKVSGTGSKKRLIVTNGSRPLADIKHDVLLESVYEMGMSSISVKTPNETCEENRAKDLESLAFKKEEGLRERMGYALLQKISSVRSGEKGNLKLGRNDLCLCGSGKKYKRCCMRRLG